MKMARSILLFCAILAAVAAPAVAQDLSDICPGAEAGTGALVGQLSDPDAEMGLPGATVVASWTIDGAPGRAEVQTAIDGGFTLCRLPLDTGLSVLGRIGAIAGEALAITLTEPITRRDLQVALTGASAGEEKMLACIGEPSSDLRFQMNEFVRCDTRWRGLENCPREDLGRVSVLSSFMPSRGGVGTREMPRWLRELIEEARELGANALVSFRSNGELVSAQAARIDVDPATC